MALVVYNTLGRKKETFLPIHAPKVSMYCCGPTVYGLLHVGNFRGPVVYNMMKQWLQHLGYQVEMAYNFTDVDDKILQRGVAENRNPAEVAQQYIDEFWKDFNALKLSPHDYNPRVTHHMDKIIEVISTLIEKNHAYVSENEVLYSVESFKSYGKLSGRKTEDEQSGYRIEVDKKKRHPADFALWKPANDGEFSWDSPWGKGRPGWHIECTAMIQAIFGNQIDIHGGGLDLCFPHHENEIAQAEGATDKPCATYWLHHNMFNFGGSKMSKSLGNVRTMRSFLEIYHGEIYKFLVLSVHYRSEADFSDETVQGALKGLAKFYSSLSLAESFIKQNSEESFAELTSPQIAPFAKTIEASIERITSSLNDDFNTPEAFAALFEMVRTFNNQVRVGLKPTPEVRTKCQLYKEFILKIGKWFALFQNPPIEFLTNLDDLLLKKMELDRKTIQSLVEQRWLAKSEKDFQEADRLRVQLTEMGISVQDTATSSSWEVAK